MISSTFARLLVTVCVSTLFMGCEITRLHILIPDFASSDVKGLQLYRVDERKDKLVKAGTIVFGEITENDRGTEVLPCTQISPKHQVWGPLDIPVHRVDGLPEAVRLEMPFVNPLESGWFKVASYNRHGPSRPAGGRIYAQALEDEQ